MQNDDGLNPSIDNEQMYPDGIYCTLEEQLLEVGYADNESSTSYSSVTQSFTAQSLHTDVIGDEYSSEVLSAGNDADKLHTQNTEISTVAYAIPPETIVKNQPEYEEDGKPRRIIMRARITHD